MQRTAGLRRPGAAALDLAYVAAGFTDGFFETGLSPWDVAAGLAAGHRGRWPGGQLHRRARLHGPQGMRGRQPAHLRPAGAHADQILEVCRPDARSWQHRPGPPQTPGTAAHPAQPATGACTPPDGRTPGAGRTPAGAWVASALARSRRARPSIPSDSSANPMSAYRPSRPGPGSCRTATDRPSMSIKAGPPAPAAAFTVTSRDSCSISCANCSPRPRSAGASTASGCKQRLVHQRHHRCMPEGAADGHQTGAAPATAPRERERRPAYPPGNAGWLRSRRRRRSSRTPRPRRPGWTRALRASAARSRAMRASGSAPPAGAAQDQAPPRTPGLQWQSSPFVRPAAPARRRGRHWPRDGPTSSS
jgi:hypothetical protein